MAIPSWPSTLPERLQISGYAESPPDVLLRTNMDMGPAKQRRRGAAGTRPVNGSLKLTSAELDIFKTFYNDTLLNGSLRFKWRDPLTDGMTRLEKTVSGVTGIVETANGMAFIDPQTDISEYDGKRIDVIDTAGKIASGYIHYNATDDDFVQMTGATSGSNGIQVADDDDIDLGTGDFAIGRRLTLASWKPSTIVFLLYKQQDGNNRWDLRLNTDGTIQFIAKTGGSYSYAVTFDAVDLADATEHEIIMSVTRGGTALLHVDGTLFSTKTPTYDSGTLSNTAALYISGTSAARELSINKSVIFFNRAPTTSEIASYYASSVAEADQYGSQANLITSSEDQNFGGGTIGNWGVYSDGNGTCAYDAGPAGEKVGKITVGATPGTYTIGGITTARFSTLTVGKRYRVSADVYLPAGHQFTKLYAYFSAINLSELLSRAATLTTTDGWQRISQEIEITGSDVTGYVYIRGNSTTAGDYFYYDNIEIVQIGATLDPNQTGITLADWQDASSNNLDASYPASGYAVYPLGTGVRVTSEADGSTYNWASVDGSFNASDTSYTVEIYDWLEMRFTEVPSITAISGSVFEVQMKLEVLP